MKNLTLVLIVILSFINFVTSQTNPNHVKVEGYYRSDGTYVRSHYRTAPNSTNRDNFSTLGNTNPYTGEPGWIQPDNNYYVPNSSSYNSTYNASAYTTNSRYSNSSPGSTYTTIKTNGQLWREPNQFNRIRPITNGTKVEVIGYEEGFWKVVSNGTVGYIHSTTINVNYEMNAIKNTPSTSSNQIYYPPNSNYVNNNSPFYSGSSNTSFSTYTTIKTNGQLWREPNQFNQIRPISSGTKVKVIGYEDGFWKVISNGTVGYIHNTTITVNYEMVNMKEKTFENYSDRNVVQNSSSNYSPYSINFNSNYDVSNNTANYYKLIQETSLRQAPDSKAYVLKRFKIGDEVNVIDSTGEWWWEVIHEGRRGWVKRRLLVKK